MSLVVDHRPHDDLYCYCLHASNCHQCGKPRTDRTTTRDAIDHMLTNPRPVRSNVFGQGPLLVSDIPASAKGSPIVLGIDEAGRGSVLGPMVYGLAYWSVDATANIPRGFQDSKQLSEETREKLWTQLLDHDDIGFACKALLPNEISRNMLRTVPYNLNEQSHDTAMTLIRKLLMAGHVTIQTCYIDTVGNAGAYQRKLEREFPNIEFVVESKADAKYAPCSAASVVAKVMRDKLLDRWQFSEPGMDDLGREESFGSGYPSDPKCKAWMTHTLRDGVFGYPDLVRFSWAPTKARLTPGETSRGGEKTDMDEASTHDGHTKKSEVQPVAVVFAADLDDEEMERMQNRKGMSAFWGSSGFVVAGGSSSTGEGIKKRKRSTYFQNRKLQVVSIF